MYDHVLLFLIMPQPLHQHADAKSEAFEEEKTCEEKSD
jgi:hypothetical protein